MITVDALRRRLAGVDPLPPIGWVEEVVGLGVVSEGPRRAIGDAVRIRPAGGGELPAEVIGFRPGGRLLLLPLGEAAGLEAGDVVRADGPLRVPVGSGIRGRLLDGLGRPLDGGPPWGARVPLAGRPPAPLERRPIREPLWTGVAAIDALLTLGRGQRIGIFAGAGVGKTTLMHQILEGTAADLAVVALVGERGREVAEFYQSLDASRRDRIVVVATTAAEPPLLRLKAVETATRMAEAARDQGLQVLLLVDSLTRVAMAAREVGLAAGEPPSARGYPPSVFAMLPRLFERAGATARGSITAVYTVLLDGDDPDDPVSDAVRGLLDGGIYLARELAERHQFPAIDLTRSLSRVMPAVVPAAQWEVAGEVRRLLSRFERARDLVELGAYRPGRDAELDRALAVVPAVWEALRQAPGEHVDPVQALARVEAALRTPPLTAELEEAEA
ncbi:flagellar-specific ATPase subunit of export apparatus [Candidatus Hydrogenisulfobacillus filiaventi]|uniref:Flagellar-specific ATPase subunit of export apparatus n=1 Tax=Candidatus Hydrogenisulfobacillus filiaventi TaxID=2707344 RepID=A0A6F8ZEX6_9FIRM|nr:flagellar-specific ATPase subunit of export apparatus [Candidatus Hydrogenisulfobacillus filiaventi]